MRARSRLQPSYQIDESIKKTELRSDSLSGRDYSSRFVTPAPIAPRTIVNHAPHWSFAAHLQHLPTLGLSIIGYLAVFYIMTTVLPAQLADWLFPSSYLVFNIALFLANFFLFSFIFLNSRRGLVIALLIQSIVFFKLQGFQITFQLAVVLLVLFVIIELVGVLLESISFGHANIKQKPRSSRRKNHS